MKQLGPYRKFVIAAAILQSIIVVVAGFFLFKDRLGKRTEISSAVPAVERQLPANSR